MQALILLESASRRMAWELPAAINGPVPKPLELPLDWGICREKIDGLVLPIHVNDQGLEMPDAGTLECRSFDSSAAAGSDNWDDKVSLAAAPAYIDLTGDDSRDVKRSPNDALDFGICLCESDRLFVSIVAAERTFSDRQNESDKSANEQDECNAAQQNLPVRMPFQPAIASRFGNERVGRGFDLARFGA